MASNLNDFVCDCVYTGYSDLPSEFPANTGV